MNKTAHSTNKTAPMHEHCDPTHEKSGTFTVEKCHFNINKEALFRHRVPLAKPHLKT